MYGIIYLIQFPENQNPEMQLLALYHTIVIGIACFCI